jgi:hypothetical protein
MQHRVVALEIEGRERPDLQAAVFLEVGDALAPLAALLAVLGEWNDRRGVDLAQVNDEDAFYP